MQPQQYTPFIPADIQTAHPLGNSPQIPLSDRLQGIHASIVAAHGILDRLERTGEKGMLGPQPPDGVFQAAETSDMMAHSLVNRLETLSARLGTL